jgi:hypothetical protein
MLTSLSEVTRSQSTGKEAAEMGIRPGRLVDVGFEVVLPVWMGD